MNKLNYVILCFKGHRGLKHFFLQKLTFAIILKLSVQTTTQFLKK